MCKTLSELCQQKIDNPVYKTIYEWIEPFSFMYDDETQGYVNGVAVLGNNLNLITYEEYDEIIKLLSQWDLF